MWTEAEEKPTLVKGVNAKQASSRWPDVDNRLEAQVALGVISSTARAAITEILGNKSKAFF